MIERDSSKAMKLVKKYKDENKLDELEKEYSEKTKWWWWYKRYGAGSINSKLLKDSGECEVVEELFPCFKNFSTGPHSEECYNDMWSYMAKAPHGCNGEVFSRIKPNLPHVKTFKEWQRGYIPSVESAIENIPKRAKESRQYPNTYTDNKANHPSENLLSAMLNSLTCFGKKPDACSDKYRSRKFRYPRPKECIDRILTNAGLPRSNPRYDPKNSSTYQYYWAVANDSNWKNGIHYDWSNSKYKQMLEQKKREYNNKSNIENNRFSYNYKSTGLHPYDITLLASYYLYGRALSSIKLWQDHDGGMSRRWVKMCYEDFRDALKEHWAPKNNYFTTIDGKIDVNKAPSPQRLKHKILNKNFVFTYKSKSGVIIKIELVDDRYITKQLYEHPFFPFWRLLPTEYYITYLYKRLQARENKNRKRASCDQHTSSSACNRNPTCSYWGGKCRPKLILTERKLSYNSAAKQCGKRYGGKLANTSGSNYNYIKNFAKRNRWKLTSRGTLKNLRYYGHSPSGTLNECEGDCDSDSQCRGNLICYQRQNHTRRGWRAHIPGCKMVSKSRIPGIIRGGDTNGDFCVDPNKTKIVYRHYRKWPHCKNKRCYRNITLRDMKNRCIKSGECDGFSWTRGKTRDWQRGSGCQKTECSYENEGRRGYGYGGYGYWVKKSKINDTFNGAWVRGKKYFKDTFNSVSYTHLTLPTKA